MPESWREPSMGELVKGVLNDTRELIREEMALARAELRQELSKARAAAMALAGAAVVAVIGVVMLFIALGGALAALLAWPAWAGYGAVALLLLTGGVVLMKVGQRRAATIHPLPNTIASVKENVEWVQKKSASR